MEKEFYFMDGKYVPSNEAVIPVRTHAFLYGTSVFEGIRAYWNEDENQLYIFRAKEHIERMFNSAKIMFMDAKYTLIEYLDIISSLLKKNNYKENCYIRPEIYKSSLKIGPGLYDCDDSVLIFTIKLGNYFKGDEALKVCVSNWNRLQDNTIPPRAKISGAYANTALMITEAKKSGFDDAVSISADGKVAEGSAMNFFLVEGNSLITTPATSNILVGVTRNTVMEIAKEELGMEIVEREINRTELYIADEAFFCGTGAQIAPIASIDHRAYGNGKTGKKTELIQKLYNDVVRGKVEKYKKWCTPVY
ncbi:MAG: branched-chain amino acid transaminase [Candidatus Gastranaerophilales bacterium]|nr:branched-chain amino acid transaminase [Candidatus Gastranaerophilales bacterium]